MPNDIAPPPAESKGGLIEAALALGAPVFPLQADKRPMPGSRGFKDATLDPARIRAMFAHPLACFVGMPTGPVSGVVVVDVDVGEGKDGREWLDANWHRLPDTRIVYTPSGGLHLYFRQPEGVRVPNSQAPNWRVARGVDVRGDGGYVGCAGAAPGGQPYLAADDATPPAEVPEWLLPLMAERQADPAPVTPAPRRPCPTEGGTPYGLRALEGECEAIRTAGFGSQEGALNAAGLKIGALVAGGELQEGLAKSELRAAARGMPSQPGRAPWAPGEPENKVLRAFADGQRKPRQAPPRTVEPDPEPESHPAAELIARAHADMGKRMAEGPPVAPGIFDVEGVLKMFVEETEAVASRSQPFLALAAAICAVGAAAGRRYETPSGLRSNIYAIGIADASGGKDNARKAALKLFSRANLKQYLGGGGSTSGAGFLTALTIHPAKLFLIDEFGIFVGGVNDKQASGPKREIRSELLKLYSSASVSYLGTEYANQKDKPRVDIESPHLCIYSTTTPVTLWKAVAGEAMKDGFMARHLVFLAEEQLPPERDVEESFEPSAGLVAALQRIAEGAEGHDHGGNLAALMDSQLDMRPFKVPLSPAAKALHRAKRDELYPEAKAATGTDRSSILGRLAENSIKLALVRAISRDPARPVMEERDIAWGWTLARHCVDTLIREAGNNISETAFEERCNRLLNMLKRRGPQTMRQLWLNGWKLSDKERDEVLRALTGNGLIREIPSAAGQRGRPTKRYAAVAGGETVLEGDGDADDE